MLRAIIAGAPWPGQTVVAAGTVVGTATQMSARVNHVTTAVGQTGVKLPPATFGAYVVVFNEGGQSAVVYPSGSDELLVAGVGAASETVAVGFSRLFVANALEQWMVFRSA